MCTLQGDGTFPLSAPRVQGSAALPSLLVDPTASTGPTESHRVRGVFPAPRWAVNPSRAGLGFTVSESEPTCSWRPGIKKVQWRWGWRCRRVFYLHVSLRSVNSLRTFYAIWLSALQISKYSLNSSCRHRDIQPATIKPQLWGSMCPGTWRCLPRASRGSNEACERWHQNFVKMPIPNSLLCYNHSICIY